MWRQHLELATGPRRAAFDLTQMRAEDITLGDAHSFLGPYLSGERYHFQHLVSRLFCQDEQDKCASLWL